MREIILDEENFHSSVEVHEFLAFELGFPPYYGANLDALNDCLGDIDEACRITVSLAEVAEEASETGEIDEVGEASKTGEASEYSIWFTKLVRTLLRAAGENEALDVLVYLSSYASFKRLEACPGMSNLLSSATCSIQTLISRTTL